MLLPVLSALVRSDGRRERLGHVHAFSRSTAFEIGERARETERAVIAAGGEL
jgi:hypothetical protein